MARAISCSDLFAEAQFFSQGVQAGEFTFVTQDARNADGTLGSHRSAEEETRRTLANLAAALNYLGQSLDDLVAVTVYIPNYSDAAKVADALQAILTNPYPAVNFVGVCGLEGDCCVRIDGIATTSRERETILLADVPTSIGARCHG
ncbi:MAG: RidA family protein, partial [Candidatus Binatia bacterium]